MNKNDISGCLNESKVQYCFPKAWFSHFEKKEKRNRKRDAKRVPNDFKINLLVLRNMICLNLFGFVGGLILDEPLNGRFNKTKKISLERLGVPE